ncbi:MAG: hypothetical protein K8R16_01485 [Anaerolineales bacterium]|nr:hypothetical protein [Anaerolineales bacterium]
MNLEYSSTGLNLNQWKILLDQENYCYFLLDNVEDKEIINWLKCQSEWQAVAHSLYLTLFLRKTIDLVIPVV